MKRLLTAVVLSTIYLLLGNIIAIKGMHDPTNRFLNAAFIEILFLPYTFIGGMSEFAGWTALSCTLELFVFIISTVIIFFLLLFAADIREEISIKIKAVLKKKRRQK